MLNFYKKVKKLVSEFNDFEKSIVYFQQINLVSSQKYPFFVEKFRH